MRAPLAQQLELIGQAVTPGGFVVGDRFTLADAFLFPLTHFVSFTPEGAQALAAAPAVARWLDRMRARPAVEATNPMAAA